MQQGDIKMERIERYIKLNIVPVLLALGLLVLYKYICCLNSNASAHASLICDVGWKTGLFLWIAYSLMKLSSPLFYGEEQVVMKLFAGTFLLYSVLYSIFGLPYYLVSFLQPFASNTFFHILILIIIVDTLIRKLFRAS